MQLRFPSFLSGSLLAAAILLAGCATTPQAPRFALTGDPVIDGNNEQAAGPKQDRVLWDYRIAASAMRLGRFDEAKAKLDDAILTMGGIIADSADAKRARSLFAAESAKTFIGEPYERAMAYYYRGILYWRDGEPDNARACFRSAEFIDSDADNAEYKGDYVLCDYLDGYVTARLGGDGSDARQRAERNRHRPMPPYDLKANVLCFVEYGRGPRKYGGGEYGEQLRFQVTDSPAHYARLTVEGRTYELPPYDDLNFQATTRGGRVMDYILGHKAVFKQGADTVGNVGLLGAAAASSGIYRRDGSKNHDAENATVALAAIGLISKLAAAATTPHADIRTWDNLPQRLSFAALRLAPGEHRGVLEFLDERHHVLGDRSREIVLQVNAEGDTVVFLSELKS
ncbi:hypothetical protein K0B96_02495 [Horticoccus luteus]|uniref:Tetratricopeptide repeat protein n=1 Tax=Horticoccus luteus TaxID=2862869 RepID=A0A8F9TWN6_9BACT|nr:hypothetical protein [Horticoccus luteus]QYM79505.1 hypothetical protein K0B96_02495 [Horticoccus luteus]